MKSSTARRTAMSSLPGTPTSGDSWTQRHSRSCTTSLTSSPSTTTQTSSAPALTCCSPASASNPVTDRSRYAGRRTRPSASTFRFAGPVVHMRCVIRLETASHHVRPRLLRASPAGSSAAARDDHGVGLRDSPRTTSPFDEPRRRAIIGTWKSGRHWVCWHLDETIKETRAELAGLEDGPSTTVWYDVVEEQG